jgi:hypothetical protein
MAEKTYPDWLPDWLDSSVYPDPKSTSREQWAWQFLRRNKQYQTQWKNLFNSHPFQCERISGGTHFIYSNEWNELAATWGIHGLPPDPSENEPKGLVFSSSLLLTVSRFAEGVSKQQALGPRSQREVVLRVPLERSMNLLMESFKAVISRQQEYIDFVSGKEDPSKLMESKLPDLLRIHDAVSAGSSLKSYVYETSPPSTENELDSKINTAKSRLRRARQLVESEYLSITNLTTLTQEIAD